MSYARTRRDEFAERCHAGGLAVTPQRLSIIQALLNSTDHPRAEEIFAEVRRQHPHISRATVHRTLETLCRIGEARKVTVLHDSARYDANLKPHQHVVCVRCRRIRDLELTGRRADFERLLGTTTALAGYHTLGWSLEIQALCDDCRACAEKRSPAPHKKTGTTRLPARRLQRTAREKFTGCEDTPD